MENRLKYCYNRSGESGGLDYIGGSGSEEWLDSENTLNIQLTR